MKKIFFVVIAMILVLGLVGGIAFGQEQQRRDLANRCFENEGMIQIMRENGFEDMALIMESGNRADMRDFMKNMSNEDYVRMQELMKENGYGNRGLGLGRGMRGIGRGFVNRMNGCRR